MVKMTEEGWMGADGKFYACSTSAHESFAKKFAWPQPQISQRDRLEERRLKVFLSYAKEDKSAVHELYKQLLQRNVDPWLDEVKLLAGQKWRTEVSKAIRETDAFVACLSKVAVSKIGYVNREFKEALEVADEQPEGKVFNIPLRLQPCDVPERFRDIQWVDYFAPNGIDSLLASLRALAEWLRQHGSKIALPM
jgi:hypothetical protein